MVENTFHLKCASMPALTPPHLLAEEADEEQSEMEEELPIRLTTIETRHLRDNRGVFSNSKTKQNSL